MKKYILSLLLLLGPFLLIGGQAMGQDAPTSPSPQEVHDIPPALEEPGFRLDDMPGDAPTAQKFKAAIRLYQNYNATLMRLKTCQLQYPEADKIIRAYVRLNGNTMRQVLNVVKQSGGLTLEIKDAMDKQITRDVNDLASSCPRFIEEAEKGAYDLHKAPQWSEDYAKMRAK